MYKHNYLIGIIGKYLLIESIGLLSGNGLLLSFSLLGHFLYLFVRFERSTFSFKLFIRVLGVLEKPYD